MSKTRPIGWQKLVDGYPWFVGEGRYPLPAYSEFMPSPRVGVSPYGGAVDHTLFAEDDPYGWRVPEIEEEYELRPGLAQIAEQALGYFVRFARGSQDYRVAGRNQRLLEGNPYWSPELEARRGSFKRERYVALTPLALGKSQDYLGRVRWTLFGNSEQGPERAFWQSFYTAPKKEIPVSESLAFVNNLLASVYGETTRSVEDLLQLGFRILPAGQDERFPYWNVDPLPKWTKPFLIADETSGDDITYLLTFRPFSKLPAPLREKYLAEKLALIPSPFTLIHWGMWLFRDATDLFPLTMQYPILPLIARHDGAGIRVPQSAWLSEPDREGKTLEIAEELVLNSYKRTHRWDRVKRDDDALEKSTRVTTVTQAMFSTALADLDLYNKPLAHNIQTVDARW